LKNLAAIFGAVKETNISGSKPALSILPCSTFQPEGISIETIGTVVDFKVLIINWFINYLLTLINHKFYWHEIYYYYYYYLLLINIIIIIIFYYYFLLLINIIIIIIIFIINYYYDYYYNYYYFLLLLFFNINYYITLIISSNGALIPPEKLKPRNTNYYLNFYLY